MVTGTASSSAAMTHSSVWRRRSKGARLDLGLRAGRLGAEVGLAPEGIAEATTTTRYEMILKNNALVANRRGVGGVPTFFIGDFPLVGAQSEDVMRQLISRAIERQISMQ